MENILRKIKTYPLGTSAQDMTTRLKWRRQYLKDLYEALKLKLASKENDHKMRCLLLMARAINRFHVTSRLSKIQNNSKEPPKSFFSSDIKSGIFTLFAISQLNSVLRLEIRAF